MTFSMQKQKISLLFLTLHIVFLILVPQLDYSIAFHSTHRFSC